MTLSVRPKVSTLVKYQVPEAFRDNNPNFAEFLEQYYRFMDQNTGAESFIRGLPNEFDPDSADEQFIAMMKKHVFPYVLNNVSPIISDAELIKFIRELYLMKGTEPSFKYVFEVLFNTKAELDYGRKYVFRSSDNDYNNLSYIILNDPNNNSILFSLLGKTLEQSQSSAVVEDVQLYNTGITAGNYTGNFVEGTNVIYNATSDEYTIDGYIDSGFSIGTLNVSVGDIVIAPTWLIPADTIVIAVQGNTITLSNTVLMTPSSRVSFSTSKSYYKCILNTESIINTFDDRLPIYASFLGVPTAFNIISLITNTVVTDSGALYSPGQKLSIIGGSGTNLDLEVHQVSAGSIDGVNIAVTGSGYSVGDKITFTPSVVELVVPAEATVTAVDGFGCEVSTLMNIDTITISDPGWNYQVGDHVNLDIYDHTGLPVTATVASVSSGQLTNVRVTSGGHGYQYARALFYIDSTHYYTTSCVLDGTAIKSVAIPSTSITATPTLYINGSGASGNMTVSGSTITWSITSGGFNYADPVLSLSVTGVTPQFNFTSNAKGTITDITTSGAFSIPNGTYPFTVVERYGSGADVIPEMGGRLTGITVTGTPLLSSGKQTSYLTSTSGVGVQGALNMTYKFHSVGVTSPGHGYDTPTLSVVGGTGSGLKLRFAVDVTGAITGVYVDNSGSGYPQSSTITLTDPAGSSGSLSLNINDYGQVTSVNVAASGTGYSENSSFSVTTGQLPLVATVNSLNGSITSISISNNGDYYTSVPTVSVVDDTPGSYLVNNCQLAQGSTLVSTTNSFSMVKPGHEVFYISGGSVLFYATVVSVTDSQNIVIDTPAYDNAWSNVQLEFTVQRGKISQVTVTNPGLGYHYLPLVTAPAIPSTSVAGTPTYRRQAKLTALSSSIGGILSVKIVDSGVNYEETPILATPISGITNELAQQFQLGELVFDSNWSYTDTTNYSDGPHARVYAFDGAKNLLQLDNATDQFDLFTENNIEIVAEDGSLIIHEQSFPFDTNTIMNGQNSNATGMFLVIQRGSTIAQADAVCFSKEDFQNNSGMLSDPAIKLHDGKRIQDYSYYVKTFEQIVNGQKNGMQLRDYKGTLTQIVHPAGYKMCGDVMLEDFQKIIFNLFRKYDKNGNAVGTGIILSFVLDTMMMFTATNYNALNSNGNLLRRQFEIILEHYVSVINSVDMNEVGVYGQFKRHMIELMRSMAVTFAPTRSTTHGTGINIYLDILYPFGFKPSELDRAKYKFKPYAGMAEQMDVLSLWTGFSYVNDINYYGANSTYWNYPNTTIGNFKYVTINEIINNHWANHNNQAYVLDSYMTIAKL